ncbi:hypothetical protein TRICI_001712 [Trichomonascus ciferrii]|uniref:Uncharacterized protein n=1 Tax=Trichomonascus ciferrii TaxID=44093 RepID=A0A642V8G6_9ASCO|nr:hypothetical protein TRICI_001712 [Trichomonascus ciferrii]
MSENGRRISPRRKSMPAFALGFNKENDSPDDGYRDDLTLPVGKPKKRMSSSRASLAPSRSILKPSNYDDNMTVTGVFNLPQNDMKPTKKMANRRVSFAPEAFVR